MKARDVVVGAVYAVKVSGDVVPVRIACEITRGRDGAFRGWIGTSEKTGREITIKSAQRLRYRIDGTTSAVWRKYNTEVGR